METMTSYDELIADAGLTMTATPTDTNPYMDADTGMSHWRCTIRRGRLSTTVVFSMGSAFTGRQPELDEVLDCLASDASGHANARDFEDWAADYGYDIDSRKAERTYRAIGRQTEGLRRVMGDLFDRLLWETERL